MPVIINGKLSLKDNEKPIIRIDNLVRWEKKKNAEPVAAPKMLCVQVSYQEKERNGGGMDKFLSEIQDILVGYAGSDRAFIKNLDDGKISELPNRIGISDGLLSELYGVAGSESVIVK